MKSDANEMTDGAGRERQHALMRRKFWRRRLGALAILICVMLATGAQLGGFLRSEGSAVERSGSLEVSTSARKSVLGTTSEPTETTASSAEASSAEDSTGTPSEKTSGGSGEAETMNVLLLGIDKRPENVEGEGTRSDTMIIARVTPGTGRVKLLSIPRDMLVEVAPGEEEKINSAYALGGIEQARSVVEDFTGLSIDHYAVVDFEGFEEGVNALGGVRVDVDNGFPNNKHIEDGEHTLNGEQALFYARYRGTPEGDLDRIKHQQQVISGLRAEALQLNTITELPQLVQAMMGNIETDVGLKETVSLGRVLMSSGEGRITSARLEGSPDTLPDGEWVFRPDPEANESILEDFRN